jgi:glycosyltransferase involved in cell wall biosynthesis
MRILQLTPGTGSFYCGTCLRDNALVVALRGLGHDAVLVPMYLPLTLDEPVATGHTPLLFGGINVYLQQIAPLFRRTPRWVDRFFEWPFLLKLAAGRAGMTHPKELGEITLSMLRGEEGNQLKELDRLAEWLRTEGRPDVICLSNILLLGMARRIREATGAAVVCTLQGEDSYLDSLPEPARSRAWDLLAERAGDVDAYVAVSRYYGDRMIERAALPRDRVRVVHCGIQLDGYSVSPIPVVDAVPTLGYLARLAPVKGLHTVVDAFIRLRQRAGLPSPPGGGPPLRLRAAGTCTTGDEAFVAEMRRKLAAAGLSQDAEFLPNIDHAQKISFLHGLTVLSVPTTYGESFGLYVIEAMAAGVPVCQPRHAAFPELIAATGGGITYEPFGADSLATSLEGLLLDPQRMRALGDTGREAVHARYSADAMARGVQAVFEEASDRRHGRREQVGGAARGVPQGVS